jgi:hypothetical protein
LTFLKWFAPSPHFSPFLPNTNCGTSASSRLLYQFCHPGKGMLTKSRAGKSVISCELSPIALNSKHSRAVEFGCSEGWQENGGRKTGCPFEHFPAPIFLPASFS